MKSTLFKIKGHVKLYKLYMVSGQTYKVSIKSKLVRPYVSNKKTTPFRVMKSEAILEYKIASGQFLNNINLSKVERYEELSEDSIEHKYWFVEKTVFKVFKDKFWSTIEILEGESND